MSNIKIKKASQVFYLNALINHESNLADMCPKQISNTNQSIKYNTCAKKDNDKKSKMNSALKADKQNSCKSIAQIGSLAKSSHSNLNAFIDDEKRKEQLNGKICSKCKKELGNNLVPNDEKEHLQNLKQNYEQNIKQVQILKRTLDKIRKNYDHLLNQNKEFSLKCKSLLQQNQQLTLNISLLKLQTNHQQNKFSSSQKHISIQQQNFQLRQQLQKQARLKQSLQDRCLNFQKRTNDYILKCNQLQEKSNQYQIKYYQMQKEYDNLKLDKKQMEVQCGMLYKKLKFEKEVHQDYIERIKKDNIGNKPQMKFYQLNQQHKQLMICHEVNYKLQNYTISSQFQSGVPKVQPTLLPQLQPQNISQSLKLLSLKYQQLMAQNENIYNGCSARLMEKQQEKSRLQKLVKQLKQLIDYKNVQNNQIRSKIRMLQGELEKGLQKILQQQRQYNKEMIQCKESFTKMQQIISQLSCQKQQILANFQEERQQFVKKIDIYQNDILAIKKQINLQFAQKICFRDRYQRQLQQYNHLSSTLFQLEKNHNQLVIQNANYSMEISSLKGQNINLRQHLLKMKQQSFKVEQSEIKIQQQQNEMFILHRQNNRLKDNIQTLQQQIQTLKLEVSTLKIHKQQLQVKLSTSQQQIKQHQQKIINISLMYESSQKRQESYLRRYEQKAKQKLSIEMILNKKILQKQEAINKIRFQAQRQLKQIQQLNKNIRLIEQNYDYLSQKYNKQSQKWSEQRNKLKGMCDKLKQSILLQRQEMEESRLSISFELDNSQNVLEIMCVEKDQLQKIYSNQIKKRDEIIKELIKQKKNLYDELIDKGNNSF